MLLEPDALLEAGPESVRTSCPASFLLLDPLAETSRLAVPSRPPASTGEPVPVELEQLAIIPAATTSVTTAASNCFMRSPSSLRSALSCPCNARPSLHRSWAAHFGVNFITVPLQTPPSLGQEPSSVQ